MEDSEWLAGRFEENRTRLRSVAYRMLGSLSEAEDAVQEAWIRLNRTGGDEVRNLSAWLTTVVGRVCLDMLRSRAAKKEDPIDPHVPDPVLSSAHGLDPEQQALLADSVGLALLVVLETLPPAERLAFVLHDMFAVPFDDIAPILARTPTATRQLASRARRRVQGAAVPDPDLTRQRQIVEAFMAASHTGDFDALVSLLHPDVVLRADSGGRGIGADLRGARTIAQRAIAFRRLAAPGGGLSLVLVNGVPGLIAMPDDRLLSVMSMTVSDGLIVEINVLADPERLARLDLSALDT